MGIDAFRCTATILFPFLSLGSIATPNSAMEICVTSACSCSFDLVYNVTVTCHTNNVGKDLRSFIKKPELTAALSVVDDNTTTIPEGTFSPFSNLRFLEIRLKNLKIWEGNLSRELPSLEVISIVADNIFIPPEHVLQAPNLRYITGVTWSKTCINCTLLKNKTHVNVTRFREGFYDIYPESRCRGSRHVVSTVSRKFAEHGFLAVHDETCYASEMTLIPMHRCYDSANRVLYAEYFLTPLIIILNLTVFATTVTTKALRKLPTMLLVANLAMSDFFVGVYSLAITSSRHGFSYPDFVGVMNHLCPALGFLWVLGQFAAALSSVLLTTERYVVIIYSMRPSISFTTRICLYSALASWTIALLMASLPLFRVGTYTTTTFCIPIQPAKGIPHSFAYSTSLVAIGVLLYTITLPMYVHIFVHVRRSGNQMGIKRDGKLAKKISILVISNLTFFLLPIIVGLLWLFTQTFNNVSLQTREILVGSFTTVCFSINSFLNPLLYAFRDRRFRLTIKQRCYRLLHPNTTFVQQLNYRSGIETRSQLGDVKQNK